MSSSSSAFRRSSGGGAPTGRFGGLHRPSLDSMKTTLRRPTSNNKSTPPPAAAPAETDDDYDGYYYDSDEEDAMLSKRHGEAMEDTSAAAAAAAASGTNNKRSANDMMEGATDKDIADEYKAQEKKQKQKRRALTTITPELLVSQYGLSKLRHVVAPKFHTTSAASAFTTTTARGNKPKFTKKPSSMAKYSRHLVAAYRYWMDDLSGGIPLEEAVWKLQTLLSKGQVKETVHEMRKQVRNEHVERTLGLERAEQLLSQLDDYYQQQQHQVEAQTGGGQATAGDDVDYLEQQQQLQDVDGVVIVADPLGDGRSHPGGSNPYQVAQRVTRSATPPSPNEVGGTITTKEGDLTLTLTNQEGDNHALATSTSNVVSTEAGTSQQARQRARHVLDDSDDDDDEAEATFDTVVEGSRGDSSNPSSSSKRRVLDDDDDDEMGEMEEENMDKNEDAAAQPLQDDRSDDAPTGASNASEHSECDKASQDGDSPASIEDAEMEAAGVDPEVNGQTGDGTLENIEAFVLPRSNETNRNDIDLDLVKANGEDFAGDADLPSALSSSQETGKLNVAIDASIQLEVEGEDEAPPSQNEDVIEGGGTPFKDFPLTQASEARTVTGTQFTEDEPFLASMQPMFQTPEMLQPDNSDRLDQPDWTTNDMSQESEVPTVLNTQGMTQEWTTQTQTNFTNGVENGTTEPHAD